jgi:hypothetical protein
MPDSLQGDEEAAIVLRSPPSLAQELVAWLEDLPKGTTRLGRQG